MQKIEKSNSIQDVSFAPFYFLWINGVINTMYGFWLYNTVIILVNFIGAGVGTYSIYIYRKYCKDEKERVVLYDFRIC